MQEPSGITSEQPSDQVLSLPLIALEGAVIFPHTVISLTLDEHNLTAVEAAMKHGRQILLAPKRPDADQEAPLAEQLFPIAVLGRIEQSGVLPGGGEWRDCARPRTGGAWPAR